METSAMEWRIVLQPSRECNRRIHDQRVGVVQARTRDVPRLRLIRDFSRDHAAIYRHFEKRATARRTAEIRAGSQPLPITPRAAAGGTRGMDCDNIAGSKHLQIGRLTRPVT